MGDWAVPGANPPRNEAPPAEKFAIANGFPKRARYRPRLAGEGEFECEHGTGEQVDNLFLHFSNFFGYGFITQDVGRRLALEGVEVGSYLGSYRLVVAKTPSSTSSTSIT